MERLTRPQLTAACFYHDAERDLIAAMLEGADRETVAALKLEQERRRERLLNALKDAPRPSVLTGIVGADGDNPAFEVAVQYYPSPTDARVRCVRVEVRDA